jgi:Caspase domain
MSMASQSVSISITLLVICSFGVTLCDRVTEEQQPGTTQRAGSRIKTNPGPAGKANKLALLVGINKYKEVNGLSGCLADVRNMQGLLRGKFDFPDDSIRVLTDEQATHAAIVAAFKDHLVHRAADNAVVVFHYSGHGSRMKDPTGKSPSGEISTIVPHDSRTKGVFDISADELRALFSLLAEKTKNVTFIFDSCHSGMVLKDVAMARARVIAPDPRDPPPPPPEALLAPRERGDASDGLKSRGYALLSACQADEVAFEYADQKGNPCGTLTHFFVAEVLRVGAGDATYRDVMDNVKAKVTGAFPRQHPQLEGANMDNILLSERSSLPQPFVLASPNGDGITLRAGQVHGITEGSVFDVYPPGTKSFDDPSQATAQAELVTVNPYQSEAKRLGGKPIRPSSRAVERRHNFQDRRIRVHIVGAEASGILGKLRGAVTGRDLTSPNNPRSPSFAQTFEVTASPAEAQLLLKETKTKAGARSISLLSADGTELTTPASLNEAGAVELVLEQLGGWASRHIPGASRARLSIAVTDPSGVFGKLRGAVAGRGRTDPDNPKSQPFSQAFDATANPADAQLLLENKKTSGGANLLVISQTREDGTDPDVLFRTATDESGAVQLVLERLTQWAKWLRLLNLDNPRPGLDIEFEIRSKTRNALDPALAKRPDLTLVAGQKAEWIVRNKSRKEVYFAILDLASDGDVDVVYPGAGRNEALAPGNYYSESLVAELPEGKKFSRDHLKLVVTQSPVDFRFLNQGSIKEAPQAVDDPLSNLLGQSALKEKELRRIPVELNGWATKIKTLEIVDKP